MAHNMRTLWGLSKGVINNTLFRNAVFNASNGRYLFTPTALKIVEYEKERHLTRAQYLGVEETFRGKMSTICDHSTGKVYMEDLKAMLYIAQKDDMPLLVKMIVKYNETESHKFVFGPVIMRALYFVDDPKTALELYNKPELSNLFTKHAAQTILMTLLYDHAMYDSVIDVWNKIYVDGQDGTVGSRSTRLLLFAALAKKNTPDALEMARTTWQKMIELRTFITREYSFYIYLLLKHDKAEEALTIKTNMELRGLAHTHLKILALLQLQMYDEVYEELHKIIELSGNDKSLIFRDVFNRVANISDELEVKQRIQNALSLLPRGNLGRSIVDNFIFTPMRNEIGREKNARTFNQTFSEGLLSKAI